VTTLPVVDPTNSCQVTETEAPVISTLIRGSQSLTSDPLKSNQPSGKLVNRPELEIQVCDHIFYALLDTGASVSAIAENTFNDLQHNLPDGRSLNVLPVNGVTVSTAIRSRSKKVTSQVLLPFSVAKFDADCIFLVVPNLATPFILGDDWLSRYKVILDYQTNMVKFPSWNHECPFRSPLETDNSVVMSSLSFSEHYELVYRSKFDQHMFSTQSVINHIRPTNLFGAVINTMSSSAGHLEPLDNLQRRVQSITSLSLLEKSQLINLLSELSE